MPMPQSPLRVAVLLSGTGRTLQNFIDLRAAGQLDISVELVIASRPGLMGSERARQAGLPNIVAERSASATLADFSRDIFARCDDAGTQLVLFAGWLSLLVVPPRYENRIMNIHPSLLPSFGGKGMYGHHDSRGRESNHGCKLSGFCTVSPILLDREIRQRPHHRAAHLSGA